jgi:superfamily II helicase
VTLFCDLKTGMPMFAKLTINESEAKAFRKAMRKGLREVMLCEQCQRIVNNLYRSDRLNANGQQTWLCRTCARREKKISPQM